jgi:hypothetical protein
MSVSQPSKSVHIVELPRPDNFAVQFRYNYFVSDESVVENDTTSKYATKKVSDTPDSVFEQIVTSKVPRCNILRWSMVNLRMFGASNTSTEDNTGLITKNFQKIVNEDTCSAYDFVAILFQDPGIAQKIYDAVSGSYLQQGIDTPRSMIDNVYRSSLKVELSAPADINPTFVNNAMVQPLRGHGVITESQNPFGRDAKVASYLKSLEKVNVNASINARLLPQMLQNAVNDPTVDDPADFNALLESAQSIAANTQGNTGDVADQDFDTFVTHFDVHITEDPTSQDTPQQFIRNVGYVIEKFELRSDGSFDNKDPIIIENPRISEFIDLQARYGATYAYKIRTIYEIRLTAIDAITNQFVLLRSLISSKSTKLNYVGCVENIPPPPPGDVNFVYDRTRINPNVGKPGSLMIHWSFPVNSQRDIKQFQVLRRRSIDVPFEVLKIYDFDDSVVKATSQESYDVNIIEKFTSPRTFWYDDDFLRGSHYIYAICCVDAHGYISKYSAQFEVWFDSYKNELQKRIISHQGAPRPYPNLYLENELFVDTIRVKGQRSKNLEIFFNPEYYEITNNSGRSIASLATSANGRYILQFINVDNQKQQTIEINIDDNDRQVGMYRQIPTNVR